MQAKALGIDGLLVTSTCNRTELYGFGAASFSIDQITL